jgi:hypothetical protein
MALYIHIGCELDGKPESNHIIDKWIHTMTLFSRLMIMETVMGL